MNWNEQLKIRIRESLESQYKHLLVKTLLAFAIRLKYAHTLSYQCIFSEFPITEGKVADIYHENNKEKSIYCYEVQKNDSPDYIKKTDKIYKEYENLKSIAGYKSVDWILVRLDDCPENLNDAWKWIKEQVR